MPLPSDLLGLEDRIEVVVEGRGVWTPAKWEGEDLVQPLWLLPLGPLSSVAKEDALSIGDVEHRLAQAGIDWWPALLKLDNANTQGVALGSVSRAKAVSLGYRLGRWAVLQIANGKLTVVYTGLGSRVDR